jgi:hypothetical protein
VAEILLYALIVIVVLWLNGLIAIQIHHHRNRRMQKIFLRHARIEHPDATVILSVFESSDRKALRNIKEQLDALSRSSAESHETDNRQRL